jgi:hypothetical protein
MNFRVDLDPTHRVIRLTVTAAVVTLTLAESCYFQLSKLAGRKPGKAEESNSGQYAAIYDLSAVTGTTITVAMIRNFARRAPSIPMGKPHVVVGKDPNIHELARIFQMCRKYRLGHRFEVVRTLGEAYKLVEARPKDFTVRLYPKDVTA